MYIYKNEYNHQQADDWLWDTIPNMKVYILPREKERKERKSVRRVSVSSLEFQPGVRKVRR